MRGLPLLRVAFACRRWGAKDVGSLRTCDGCENVLAKTEARGSSCRVRGPLTLYS